MQEVAGVCLYDKIVMWLSKVTEEPQALGIMDWGPNHQIPTSFLYQYQDTDTWHLQPPGQGTGHILCPSQCPQATLSHHHHSPSC